MPADGNTSSPADTSSPTASLPAFHHFNLSTVSTKAFRLAEVQFQLKKVTNSRTQAGDVLATIPDTLFPQMLDWLDSKGDNPIDYQDLKAFLLRKFSLSAEKRVSMLFDLSKQALGDQRPSEALTEKRSLSCLSPDAAGTSKKIDIFLSLWLRRRPDPVRATITNFSDFTDNDLAACTNSLLDAHKVTTLPPIHAVTSFGPPDEVAPPSSPPDDTIAAAPPSRQPPYSNRASTRSQTQEPRPHPQKDSSSSSFRTTDFAAKLCYYHSRFGHSAKKCEKPCA